VIKISLQIAVLVLFHNYLAYCLIGLLPTIINNILITITANRLYPFLKEKVRLDTYERRQVFKNMGSMFVYKLAAVLMFSTSSIIISVVVSTAAVGIYSNYSLIISTLSSLMTMVFASMTASIGDLIVRETPEERYRVFRIMLTAAFWLGGTLAFCAYFMLNDFICLWLGHEYTFDQKTVAAIIINFYVAAVVSPIRAFREGTGMFRKIKYLMVASLILYIFLAVAMGSYFGVSGIVFAMVLAITTTYFWYEPMVLYHQYFKAKARNYFAKHVLNLSLLVLAIIICSQFVSLMPSNTWLLWICKGIVLVALINCVFYVLYRKTTEYSALKETAKRMIRSVTAKEGQNKN
jgi:O-antigen/teichoic acid export membrane protein